MDRSTSTEVLDADAVVRPFVPATLEARPAQAVERTAIILRHWVRDVGRDKVHELAGDPLDARVSPFKILLNTASIFVVVLVAALALLSTAPMLFGYEPVAVVSGSMEPTIQMADVVITAPSDGEGLNAGTVINFEQDGTTRLHRILEATEEGYETAGDANPTPDTELVAPSQVRGVGTLVVPFVGLPRLWMAEGDWLRLGLAFVFVSAALYTSRARWVDDGLIALAAEART